MGGRGRVLPEEREPKITYRSGWHKAELDLLVARQQQLGRVKGVGGRVCHHTAQTCRL